MAITNLSEFLEDVVKDACTFMSIRDIDKNLQIDDPVVMVCAKAAYIIIKNYCKRPFRYNDTIKELYPTFKSEGELLRTSPVDTITKVTVNDVELAVSEYTLEENTLILSCASTGFLTGQDEAGSWYDDPPKVIVEYSGGHKKISENEELFSTLT